MVAIKSLLAVLPILAAAPAVLANHFILSHKMLVTTRLDPIVNPGGISGHVHTIAGASSFDKTMDYAKSRSASCTTAVVSEDKSNYWTPQLYYYNPTDATFTMIPVAFMNTYYLARPGYDGERIYAFPDGLRMLQGNPFRKTFDPKNPDDAAISFVCLGGDASTANDPEWFQRNNFFNHNCPGGMRAQVNFRSCWDGKNLDSADHMSHMAWPSGGVDGGTCPSSHPVHLPMLFYEVIYEVQNFPYNGNGTTWVFAQGDTTGYGMHGDFVNGWPSLVNGTNILQQAIDQCDVGGVVSNCAPFVPFLNQASAGSCQPANPKVDEDIGNGHGITALPGNNPVTISGSTYVSTANNSAIGYVSPKSTIPADYSYVGCIGEGSSGRALTGSSWISTTAMTRGACVSYCSGKGFAYAGVEYGQECYCDNTLRNGASSSQLLNEDQCGSSCPALSTENCGGGSTLSLYVNPKLVVAEKKSTIAPGYVQVGCIAEAQGARALTGATYTSSTMSGGACTAFCASKGMPLAGIEYGSECYCGMAMSNGASNTTLLDASRCSMACSDSQYTENCGGSSTLTLYQNVALYPVPKVASSSVASSSIVASSSAVVSSQAASSSVAAPAVPTSSSASSSAAPSSSSAASVGPSSFVGSPSQPPSLLVVISSSVVVSSTKTSSSSVASATPSGKQSTLSPGFKAVGCIAEATNSRALTGASYTSSTMSQQSCTAFCASKGMPLAGVEYSSECYCGYSMSNGASNTTLLASSKCAMPCSDKTYSESCGGAGTLSLFENTALYPTVTLPTGWTYDNCRTEASSGRGLTGYSFTSDSMTLETCLKTCDSKGFAIAGVEYGRECYCSNAWSNNAGSITTGCNMPCGGAGYETCGAGSKLSTYVKASSTAPRRRGIAGRILVA